MHKDVLEKARQTYGGDKQLAVAMEELAELTAVVAKYFRYDNKYKAIQELQPDVASEIADALIVIDHIKSLFNLTELDIQYEIDRKIQRLERWMLASPDLTISTVDRRLDG